MAEKKSIGNQGFQVAQNYSLGSVEWYLFLGYSENEFTGYLNYIYVCSTDNVWNTIYIVYLSVDR